MRIFDLSGFKYQALNLENFLNDDSIYKEGFLQEFVEPLDSFNNEFLVNWSDQFLTIERVSNINKFSEKKIDLYERYSVLPHMVKWCQTSTLTSDLLKCIFTNLTNTMAQVTSSFTSISTRFSNHPSRSSL